MSTLYEWNVLIEYDIFSTEILILQSNKGKFNHFQGKRYQANLSLVQKNFNIPVSARTDESRRAILLYYRAKSGPAATN